MGSRVNCTAVGGQDREGADEDTARRSEYDIRERKKKDHGWGIGYNMYVLYSFVAMEVQRDTKVPIERLIADH